MGKSRVELRRIESKINRQVTFAKRRNALFKKAYELSVLCDAEVALVIFSSRGKLFEFSSCSSSILKTLERYQRCNYGAPPDTTTSVKEDLEHSSSFQEYLTLKRRYEALQKLERNYMGEDLGSLSTKELQSLESQLHLSLMRIRSARTQNMVDRLHQLQKKKLEERSEADVFQLDQNTTSRPPAAAKRVPQRAQSSSINNFQTRRG